MDIWCWIMDMLGAIGRFLAKPFHQSLILIWFTVLVLGAQLAIACTGGGMPGLAPVYVILLLLYQAQSLSILLREIKEVPANGTQDLSPTDE